MLVELNERVAGFNERENETWQRFARLFSWVVSSLQGKVIPARDLMPEVFPVLPELTEEQKKEKKKADKKELEEIKKTLKIK